MTSIGNSFPLEICQFSNFLIFNLDLLSYMVSARDLLCDIFAFMLSIPLINLVLLLSY